MPVFFPQISMLFSSALRTSSGSSASRPIARRRRLFSINSPRSEIRKRFISAMRSRTSVLGRRQFSVEKA